MRILISNDDGIFSPGLIALAEVASQFGEVKIFAPDYEQSAMGHAITIKRPLQYRRVKLIEDFEAYRVNGTPADCVAMGLYHMGGADLVLSGINLGTNLGSDIWHSGTVAAAKQGTILGVRGIAFSQMADELEPNYSRQKPFVAEVIKLLMADDMPMLVNVNLPDEPQELRWTHQSVRHYNGAMVESEDPNGRKHYWFAATPLSNPDEGSDRWAFEQSYVTLTPLQLGLTDEDTLAKLKRK